MKEPRTVKALIMTDPVLEAAVKDAQTELDRSAHTLLSTFPQRVSVEQAKRSHEDPEVVAQAVYEDDQAALEALKGDLLAAQEALVPTIRTFTFRPIGWKAWRALTSAHPAKGKPGEWDVDAVAPVLLRDASHEPRLTATEVEDILSSPDWSAGEVHQLIEAAVAAQS